MLDVPYPYARKMARDLVSRKLKAARAKNQQSVSFVIDIGGEAAGGITIDKKPFSAAEVSIWLGKKFRGKGIATHAAKLAAEYCFKKLKLVRVYAFVFPSNKASIAALKRAGFRYEGLLRKNSQRLGKRKFYDDLLYAKVR